MAKNILTLNSQEAMDFFMKSEQYHGFELPEYFTLDQVLRYVRETIGVTSYEECRSGECLSRSTVRCKSRYTAQQRWTICRSSYYACKSFLVLFPCS